MRVMRPGDLSLHIVIIFATAQCAGIACQSATAGRASERQARIDSRHVEQIVPGFTARKDILAWFGEPRTAVEFDDGTSRWVYQQNQSIDADGDRAKDADRSRARREANAKRLAENSKALATAGRNFVGWLDRKFHYPPRPLRPAPKASSSEATSVSAAAADAVRDDVQESEIDEGDASNVILTAHERDSGSALARTNLSIRFARDGFVDRFEYGSNADRNVAE